MTECRSLSAAEIAAIAGAGPTDCFPEVIPVFRCPVGPAPKTVPLIGPTVCPPPPSIELAL